MFEAGLYGKRGESHKIVRRVSPERLPYTCSPEFAVYAWVMQRKANVIGQNVAKFRYQRNWTQDELVAKLQLLGCYMTRDILANIETQRRIVTDIQVRFFAEVFGISLAELFPVLRRNDTQTMWLTEQRAKLRSGQS